MKTYDEKPIKERIREYEECVEELTSLMKKLGSRMGGFAKAKNDEGMRETQEIVRSIERRQEMFLQIIGGLILERNGRYPYTKRGCPGKINSGAEYCWQCLTGLGTRRCPIDGKSIHDDM